MHRHSFIAVMSEKVLIFYTRRFCKTFFIKWETQIIINRMEIKLNSVFTLLRKRIICTVQI